MSTAINTETDYTNPSIILQKHRPDLNQIYSEDFDEETSIFRKLCLLPFEPIWYYLVIILGLINSMVAILNCIYMVSGDADHRMLDIFYFCDVVWCLNTSLLLCDKYMQGLKTTQILFPQRRLWWFTLDYISICPIELFVPTGLKAYLGLNKTLKIVYIIFVFRFVNSMLESKICIRIFQLICLLLYFITLASLIFTVVLYNFDSDPNRLSTTDIFYIVADHMTGKGFGQMAVEHYINKFFVISSSLVLFVGVLVICTANVTFLFFTASAEKDAFRYKYNCLINQIKRRKFDPEFIECLDVMFDTMWTQSRGNEESVGGRRLSNKEKKSSILSKTFLSEITIDMCTGIFKHSLLLKQLPVAFLRDLSVYVTYEVYVQHQLICKLDEMKDKMIYIFKGIVEIISDEDGETPIMKLTAGTCLSEVCLFVPYRSNFLVRCASTCIFHILRREDFMRMVQKYPAIHKELRQTIESRFNEARDLKKIQDIFNKRADRIQKCTNMCWLLYILHKMTAHAHPHVAPQHTMANMLLERIINEDRFKNHIFSPIYLPLYAVPEERQDYKDTLFAKSTFPYVFKPDTGLTLFWEIFIAAMALVAGVLIPFFAFTYQRFNMKNVYNAVYFFTGLWLVDIIIQLRISIEYEKKIVSGFLDILIMKLTSIIFLLDIVSVIPVELFTGIVVYDSNINYVYMNRIFKLARVVRLLARWEGRYNSNPLYVRLVCAILFLAYSVFILSCIFYYIGYQDDGGRKQFEILLFYSSQMLTGVCAWVNGYSYYREYQLVTITLYLLICTVYSVVYGMIFSAYASTQLDLLRVKHHTKALIGAAVDIDPRYEYYIHDAMHDIITVDNGFPVQSPGYLYNTLPREFVGYFFEISYEPLFKQMPLFIGISTKILKQIFEEGAYTRNYNAHEVIFHVGDLLEDLFLLMSGTCEVINGVNLRSSFIRAVCELNSVEICLQIPMRTTVITLSHCRVLYIKYAVMRKVLYRHGSTKGSVRGQLSGFRDLRTRIQHSQTQYFNPDLLDNRKKEMAMKSYVFFSRTNPFYLDAYKSSGMFKMRWMFMNLTFCPGGNFMQMWEIGRCVCAVLSALFFTSITLCFYKVPHPLGVLKWALEVMAILDIYIRLHVAYYNEMGVLVTHPANTIIYYIKHGLLVDLVAALPLHLAITKAEYIILNINKILQLHRYLSFMHYKQTDKVVPLNKLYMFAHLPAMLVWINVMSSLILLFNCHIDMSDPYNASIECKKGSIFYYKDYPTQIKDPSVAHVHAIYMVVSTISRIAVQGFSITSRRNMLLFAMFSFFGFCLDVINAARVFGFYIYEYVEMMHNDVRMKLLKKFVSGQPFRTNNELIHEAEIYTKRVWTMDRSNVHKHSKDFPANLRRDIFYKKFAPVLTKYCLDGASGIEALVRNLLVQSDYRIFETNGIVQRTNDIAEHTVIIFRGLVYIDLNIDLPTFNTGSNMTHQSCVSLGPGSIIGNLCPLKYNRLKVTLVAIGVLELLYIKTNTFFEILQHFPECQTMFNKLRCVHVTHIPGTSNFKYPTLSGKGKRNWKITNYVRLSFLVLNLLNFVGAYLPQIIFFYDIIIVSIHNNLYLLINDGCYLIAIIMVFFLPITNEKGDLMSSSDIIKKFFKPWLFYISLIGAIPIYVFIPNMDNMFTFYIIAAARVNVLLRNFFFFKIVNTSIIRAQSIMFVLKFVVNISIAILSIGGTTALLIFISDASTSDMRPQIELNALLDATTAEKHEHMVTYLYIVTNMYTHTSQPFYYPVGLLYIIVFIIMMSLIMVYNTVIYSTVTSMVQAIEQLKLRYLSEKNQIRAFMEKSDTSSILVDRLEFYCKMTWKNRKGFKIPELFLELPWYLLETMAEDLFGRILDTHEFFGQIHYDMRRQLYRKLKLEYYYHGDFIAYEGTINETMYFVHKGTVVSLLNEGTTIWHTIEPGGSFALMQGIKDNLPHDLSYRTVCDSVILSLAKKDWDYMLHFYPASKKIILLTATTLYKSHID